MLAAKIGLYGDCALYSRRYKSGPLCFLFLLGYWLLLCLLGYCFLLCLLGFCCLFEVLLMLGLLALLSVLAYQFASLLLNNPHAYGPIFLSIHPISRINDGIILLHNLFVLDWKNAHKPPQMFILILISQLLSLGDHFLPLPAFKDLSLACQQPLLVQIFGLAQQFAFAATVDIHQFQRIVDEIEFYFLIERRVSRETGGVIDLQQHRLSLSVEHNIQPEYMKAHVSGIVLGLRTLILMTHKWQPTNKGLYSHIIDLVLERLNVYPPGSQLLEHAGQRALMPDAHIAAIIIEYKFGVVFVDGVVGKMHILMLQVGCRRLHVLFGGQPCQSLVEHVQPQGVCPAEKDVDS